jgi:tetratricopeptide (TPR) repeat protein
MDNLVISYARHGRHADALKVEEETLSVRKARLGPVHPDTLTNMNNLANRYGQLARFADAVKLHEETLALRKAKLGPDHPDTLSSMFNLANSYDQLGRHADAVKLSEERLAIQKTKLGPDHPDTLRSMNGVALMYAAVGRLADALKLHEETLALYQAKFPENPDKLSSIYNIGCVHALMAAKSDDPNKEAELAMDWLKKAVAAGFKDVEQIKKDTDLDPVRARDDFKKLVADLEQAKAASTPAAKK